MESCSSVGINTIDEDQIVTEQSTTAALDPVSQQQGKKRKTPTTDDKDSSSESLDKSAQEGEEGLTAKRAKTTGGPEASGSRPSSTMTAETGATEALVEVREGEDGINEPPEDSEARGNGVDAAEGQLVVGTGSGEVPTIERNGVSSVTGTVVPSVGKVAPVVPRGRCVSGRVWKTRQQSQSFHRTIRRHLVSPEFVGSRKCVRMAFTTENPPAQDRKSSRASLQVTTATVTLSTSWKKKLEIKAKRQAAIALEQEMRDRKRQEIEDKKQEKLERERRRQRNEMKNTTYHTISKTHKLKTMNKKQLRQIKKRQINSRTGEVEFVSPWGGGKK